MEGRKAGKWMALKAFSSGRLNPSIMGVLLRNVQLILLQKSTVAHIIPYIHLSSRLCRCTGIFSVCVRCQKRKNSIPFCWRRIGSQWSLASYYRVPLLLDSLRLLYPFHSSLQVLITALSTSPLIGWVILLFFVSSVHFRQRSNFLLKKRKKPIPSIMPKRYGQRNKQGGGCENQERSMTVHPPHLAPRTFHSSFIINRIN